MAADDDVDIDVRAPSPLARLRAWLGPPRDYQVTRALIVRLLGAVYAFAFLGLIRQGPALLGEDGLTPAATYVARLHDAGLGAWDVPSLFMWGASDASLQAWAWIGLALSIGVVAGFANVPIVVALWVIYGSYVRVGQLWFGFGWEIQILETTLLAVFLVHPWRPRLVRAGSPPIVSVVLVRWLVFRIMLGAGLIKLRGADCWTELTCLDVHFETQPIPNPLSAWFHDLPHVVKATGVAFNHVVEIVLPWCVFGPRRLRIVAGIGMGLFQVVLIISGNLAFLNWLTLLPILACFDDDAIRAVIPRRWRTRFERAPSPPSRGMRIAAGCFAAVVAIKSVDVVGNLASHRQVMNRSYDRLALVNTYGAFGSVTLERHELVIEGTRDPDPATAAWRAYELPCKPGDLDRRPCILGPYHRRLDWLIWFAAMSERPRDPWIVHLVWKLLDGEPTIRELFAVDPFDGAPPTFVRIRRFRYHLEPLGAEHWWTRDSEQLWVPPVSRDSAALREVLAEHGWSAR